MPMIDAIWAVERFMRDLKDRLLYHPNKIIKKDSEFYGYFIDRKKYDSEYMAYRLGRPCNCGTPFGISMTCKEVVEFAAKRPQSHFYTAKEALTICEKGCMVRAFDDDGYYVRINYTNIEMQAMKQLAEAGRLNPKLVQDHDWLIISKYQYDYGIYLCRQLAEYKLCVDEYGNFQQGTGLDPEAIINVEYPKTNATNLLVTVNK